MNSDDSCEASFLREAIVGCCARCELVICDRDQTWRTTVVYVDLDIVSNFEEGHDYEPETLDDFLESKVKATAEYFYWQRGTEQKIGSVSYVACVGVAEISS